MLIANTPTWLVHRAPSCSAKTPAFAFTMGGCPGYVQVDYVVILGVCSVGLIFDAGGPGPCN